MDALYETELSIVMLERVFRVNNVSRQSIEIFHMKAISIHLCKMRRPGMLPSFRLARDNVEDESKTMNQPLNILTFSDGAQNVIACARCDQTENYTEKSPDGIDKCSFSYSKFEIQFTYAATLSKAFSSKSDSLD